jgi:3',5'-cyclic AMP phosphodiesterase CpdA
LSKPFIAIIAAMFVLAHLSDPHVGPLPRPGLAALAGKRAFGFANWHLRRRRGDRPAALDAITEDVRSAMPDHIAVTGDLINIALEQEFASALAWLERLGPPDRVTLVPGNHDAYARATALRAAQVWDAYMRGDSDHGDAARFPFLRRRGPIALIGLSTALPTLPLMATGLIGPEQLTQLSALLERIGGEGLFRVVLIHHPPAGLRARHKRLVDAAALVEVLTQRGADLVLHGHDHLHSVNWLAAPHGRIPVVGVPSSSETRNTPKRHPAAYNLYRIEGAPGAWRCEAISRGLRAEHGVRELRRETLIG